jgi:gluconolactonase
VNPNHSVFDRAGNMYFTDSGSWDGADGYIYRLSANGAQELVSGPFRFPNGIAQSDDERFLFVAESQTDSVLRIEIDSNGHAQSVETYARDLPRIPDGIVLDEQGNLYVMCYASDAIHRVSPDRKVELLVYDREATHIARPTNAAFGGANHDDLFIANFGRWHISRLHIGIPGQRFSN